MYILDAGGEKQRHQRRDAGDEKCDVVLKIVNQQTPNAVAEKHAKRPRQRQKGHRSRGIFAVKIANKENVVEHPGGSGDAVSRLRQIEGEGVRLQPRQWPGDNRQDQRPLDKDFSTLHHIGNNPQRKADQQRGEAAGPHDDPHHLRLHPLVDHHRGQERINAVNTDKKQHADDKKEPGFGSA